MAHDRWVFDPEADGSRVKGAGKREAPRKFRWELPEDDDLVIGDNLDKGSGPGAQVAAPARSLSASSKRNERRRPVARVAMSAAAALLLLSAVVILRSLSAPRSPSKSASPTGNAARQGAPGAVSRIVVPPVPTLVSVAPRSAAAPSSRKAVAPVSRPTLVGPAASEESTPEPEPADETAAAIPSEEDLFRVAAEYVEVGDRAAAERVYRDLMSSGRQAGRAATELADLEFAAGNYAAARDLYQEAARRYHETN